MEDCLLYHRSLDAMPAARRAETLLCQNASVKLWSCAPAGSPLPACILQLQISSPWRSQAHGPSWKGFLQSLLITAAMPRRADLGPATVKDGTKTSVCTLAGPTLHHPNNFSTTCSMLASASQAGACFCTSSKTTALLLTCGIPLKHRQGFSGSRSFSQWPQPLKLPSYA